MHSLGSGGREKRDKLRSCEKLRSCFSYNNIGQVSLKCDRFQAKPPNTYHFPRLVKVLQELPPGEGAAPPPSGLRALRTFSCLYHCYISSLSLFACFCCCVLFVLWMALLASLNGLRIIPPRVAIAIIFK